MSDSIQQAEKIENILNDNGIDFAVALEAYLGSVLFSERNGIAFYVLSGQENYCRNLLAGKGLSSCLTVDEPGIESPEK